MKTSGFTLLETIMYCAVFSILMSGIIVSTYALLESSADMKHKTNIIAEATFINQKLDWLLRGAEDVVIENEITLKITRPDMVAANPFIVFEKDGQLYLSRGLDVPKIIMNESYIIKDLEMVISNDIFSFTYSLENTPFTFSINLKN